MSAPLDITGLARHSAGRCDACGYDAVELLITREDAGHDGAPLIIRTCRACDGLAFCEPDAEIVLGDAVDQGDEQLGMFDVAPTSTFSATYGAATDPTTTTKLF